MKRSTSAGNETTEAARHRGSQKERKEQKKREAAEAGVAEAEEERLGRDEVGREGDKEMSGSEANFEELEV